MNARNQAIAAQDLSIDRNIAAINEQKARPSAIEAMAQRLNISPSNLQKTLLNTVFKGAKESEFAALIVVANEYGLNPLLKEIYAFPAKGGGIVPVVSIDGWIRIANQHPQYDGDEQSFIYDDAKKLFAVETAIYRKDRSHPTKKMEFLSECKRNTDPWKMEHRMLGHKGYIQAVRYAFGFAGIFEEDDADTIIDYVPQQTVPTSRQLQQQEAQQQQEPPYDAETGEILNDAESDAAAEREADRLNGNASDEPDEINEVNEALDDEPMWMRHYNATIATVLAAQSSADLKTIEVEFVNHRATYDDDAIATVEREIASAKKRLGQGA